jgi:hypothetical protein
MIQWLALPNKSLDRSANSLAFIEILDAIPDTSALRSIPALGREFTVSWRIKNAPSKEISLSRNADT